MSMRSQRAFTLIELLFVVAVIAILAAIAVPNFLMAQTRSKISRTLSDMAALNAALRIYGAQYDAYPPNSPKIVEQLKVAEDQSASVEAPVFNNQPNRRGAHYQFLDSSGWDLTRLTTPAAWISNALPMDVFKKSYKNLMQEEPPNPLLYINLADLQKDARTCSTAAAWGFVIISYGPNQSLDLSGPPSEPLLIYDPTNGTVSDGDVVSYGW
jgi:prepilin-type N-terminal cleavage/methylation domain-containing protein